MIDRRLFLAGAAGAVAAPFVLRTSASAQTAPLKVRRDVMTFAPDDPFFAKYGEAVKRMHALPASDPRNWRNQALIHLNHCPHGAIDFCHWHRFYILYFEQICQTLLGDTSFTLPYWNWSAKIGQIPDPFYDLDYLNVTYWKDPSDAQSDNWGPEEVTTIGVRALQKGQGVQQKSGVFSPAAIASIQAETEFSIYTNRLETSPHNTGHVIVGGSQGHMGDGMSPLDPIFWLHHCNIDRLWAQWENAGNSTPALDYNYDGEFVNGQGKPAPASSAASLDFRALGYTYDVIAAESAVAGLAPVDKSFQAQTLLQASAVGGGVRTLGAARNQQVARVGEVTSYTVSADNLLANLFRPRTFWSTQTPQARRLAVEPGRVLARVTGVSVPNEARSVLVNVFVNAPNPSAATPYTDPHYAGTFSFFGMAGKSHAGHGDGSGYVVDITDALQTLAGAGRIESNDVKVQLVPVPVEPSAKVDAGFTVGGVEIVTS